MAINYFEWKMSWFVLDLNHTLHVTHNIFPSLDIRNSLWTTAQKSVEIQFNRWYLFNLYWNATQLLKLHPTCAVYLTVCCQIFTHF